MKVPSHPFGLMTKIYRKVLPQVHSELAQWKERAKQIPNEELRTQALASIDTKTFHCEGGSIYGILAGSHIKDSIKFIVAYQTISDYLDNLCDRSTSLDPEDFRTLHQAMIDALTPSESVKDYYKCREDRDDGGYLQALVTTCQEVLLKLPGYERISSSLIELCQYYCDLQVHKHVKVEERVPRLQKWFAQYKKVLPEMTWYEFSACAGSTLGIFCLVSYAFHPDFKQEDIKKVRQGYFPYVQGLHILLDYFIDQEEDRIGGDLNFCFYYPHNETMVARFAHFINEADRHVKGLPHEKFHKLINRGLIGIYLSDRKVKQQESVHQTAKQLIKYGGVVSKFFYFNGRWYRSLFSGS
ncbi:tetraprenyl-beta-curcumene synthase family protein [Bacillus solimangrovi]|uniref:Tetraprenyl-beta-curcumene synthase n=1 Tax=Bacillus solimangrovi TaxID=1305675 RepID=A0A1E5LDL0_9BACI|nr:tetraprenyl-beta-curcumene synthase [Bacillus solimangrovi]